VDRRHVTLPEIRAHRLGLTHHLQRLLYFSSADEAPRPACFLTAVQTCDESQRQCQSQCQYQTEPLVIGKDAAS
jgi:hypothetical protein